MSAENHALDQFLSLSEALTGFDTADLLGSGLAQTNLDKLVEVVGQDIAAELWAIATELQGLDEAELDQPVRHRVMASAK